MFQSFQEIRTLTTSEMSRVPGDALSLQDHEDRAFRVASSIGDDLSLDEPLLDFSDLWFLNSTLMVTNVHSGSPEL